jgi:integrase
MTKKKTKQKTARGEIAITVRDRMLYLRIPYQGKRKMLSTGFTDNPLNRIKVNEIKTRIEKDLVSDTFDPSLDKYRPKKKADLSTVQLFQNYIVYLRKQGTSENSINRRYECLLGNLKHFAKDITNEALAKQFMSALRNKQSTETANRNQTMMVQFCQWANIDPNPFANLPKPKANPKRREAFMPQERQAILTAFANHPTYSHYYPFVYALFATGMRVSEVIGLQWKHIDFDKGLILVAESLSRSPNGKSSSRHRIRKGTKTGQTGITPMTDGLRSLLMGIRHDQPDDLVFTTVTGLPIDDHTFSQRVWRKVLADAGIPHRPPYSCRHTFASSAIEHGLTLVQTASLLRHKNTHMVSRVYAHAQSIPVLPEIETLVTSD